MPCCSERMPMKRNRSKSRGSRSTSLSFTMRSEMRSTSGRSSEVEPKSAAVVGASLTGMMTIETVAVSAPSASSVTV
ncbi:hypothetical protein D9M68_957920 [compost metagenome]